SAPLELTTPVGGPTMTGTPQAAPPGQMPAQQPPASLPQQYAPSAGSTPESVPVTDAAGQPNPVAPPDPPRGSPAPPRQGGFTLPPQPGIGYPGLPAQMTSQPGTSPLGGQR